MCLAMGFGDVGLSKTLFCHSSKMTNTSADLWELFELSLIEDATWFLGVGHSADLFMEFSKRKFLFPEYEHCLCKISACYLIFENESVFNLPKTEYSIWWHACPFLLSFFSGLSEFYTPCLVQRARMSTGCSSWWSSISSFPPPAHLPLECMWAGETQAGMEECWLFVLWWWPVTGQHWNLLQ